MKQLVCNLWWALGQDSDFPSPTAYHEDGFFLWVFFAKKRFKSPRTKGLLEDYYNE